MDNHHGFLIFATLTCLTTVFIYLRTITNGKRPPGPKGLPVLGNLLQLPHHHLATYFRNLIREHGDVLWLDLVRSPVLVLGNMRTAKDILDKRSSKFSSRPSLTFIERYTDPMKAYWGFHGINGEWFTGRRLTASVMSSVKAGYTEPLQHFEALLTIRSLVKGNQPWHREIDRMVISSTFAILFGVHFRTSEEPELQEAIFAINEVSRLFSISGSIINFFPFLDWIPGPMPWRAQAKEFHRREKAFYSKLVYEAVSGNASDMYTWAGIFAKEDTETSQPSHSMNQFAGAAFDTTGGALKSFVLACLVYPGFIQKAQSQLDDAVGSDRVPTFGDRPRLPYIDAIVREILRWRPPGRAGIPHCSTEDDIVEDNGQQYFIPAGTIVFAPPWAIEHDSTRYTQPDTFDPDRFIGKDGQLLKGYETSTFGFGRRGKFDSAMHDVKCLPNRSCIHFVACPGSPLAERAIWVMVALMLWAFEIHKSDAVDPKTGKKFIYDTSDAAYCGDMSNVPLEFPAVFAPRSSRHAEVVRREWEECEKALSVLLPAPTGMD